MIRTPGGPGLEAWTLVKEQDRTHRSHRTQESQDLWSWRLWSPDSGVQTLDSVTLSLWTLEAPDWSPVKEQDRNWKFQSGTL